MRTNPEAHRITNWINNPSLGGETKVQQPGQSSGAAMAQKVVYTQWNPPGAASSGWFLIHAVPGPVDSSRSTAMQTTFYSKTLNPSNAFNFL